MIEIYQRIALIIAVLLPFFNIPLIIRMIQRRSSQDISLFWAVGVWTCLLIMLPSALTSPDIIWKTFSVTNVILFSCVVITVLYFRKKKI
ncbi:MAG TPA: hypothetical protein PLH56_03165 [Candidatus Omnitrophota bacterium]|nr:hypothetical protein [Candidatus Omnitrophota bacterium]HPN88317.1 hypothetical protein [Candidatus Omnitrophota bacterium]